MRFYRLHHSKYSLSIVMGLLALIVLSVDAYARPGGGGSYSGGRSSYSGGSGSDSGALFGLIFGLLRFCFRFPLIGIPLLIFIGFYFYRLSSRNAKLLHAKDYSIGGHGSHAPHLSEASRSSINNGSIFSSLNSPRHQLEKIRSLDHNFSLVLLDDFLTAFYVEIYRARGLGKLSALTPYVDAPVLAKLHQASAIQVRDVVIGALRTTRVAIGEGENAKVQIEIDIEANYTEVKAGQELSYYVHEKWRLERNVNALSRTPERVSVFACPNCGAPLEYTVGGVCKSCHEVAGNGTFDWLLTSIQVMNRETRGPMLTGSTEEYGNELPTVMHPDVNVGVEQLRARDQDWSLSAFEKRVALIFNEFQVAWSTRDLTRMRPFLSDNLLQTQAYWVDAYKQQKLRNVTENARIEKIMIVRVASDVFYDSITLRVWAVSRDYTVKEDGQLVSGSKSSNRAYTEYWTLIRGSQRQGAAVTEANCPSCGASLSINMSGHCEYCQAKVNSGAFDWVLSRIEQDDSYTG